MCTGFTWLRKNSFMDSCLQGIEVLVKVYSFVLSTYYQLVNRIFIWI
jgi:hypothetical protein